MNGVPVKVCRSLASLTHGHRETQERNQRRRNNSRTWLLELTVDRMKLKIMDKGRLADGREGG